MRDRCEVALVLGTKLRQLEPRAAAASVFEHFRGCRVLAASYEGAVLKVVLLLPEVPGGYSNTTHLKSFIEEGLYGKGAVLSSVVGLREATTGEILERTLSSKRGAK